MSAPVVDALRILDFFSYVLWIESYMAAAEEHNRKMNEGTDAT